MKRVVLATSAGAGESALGMDGEAQRVTARLAEGIRGTTSEGRLIRAAQRGSEEALEQLFRAHWPRAHRAAFLVVHDGAAAEDIAQEAFLAAIRALGRFDRRRPFGPWLHRIVVNRAIDHARSRKLRREVEPGAEPEDERAAGLDSAGLSDELVAALRTLSPEHRAVVVLRYLLDFTPGEIADALEMPRGTVNSRLRRGLDRLSLVLEEER
jgi:RNA polymerase sigma-70 factor (ECF subfamily)